MIEKAFGKKDISKLVPMTIVDKRGRRVTVYVRPDKKQAVAGKKVKEKISPEWKKYGFDAKEAKEWIDRDFDAEEAAMWRDAGYDYVEASDWREVYGVHEPHQAKEWEKHGFDRHSAKEWAAYDFKPEEAKEWHDAGFRTPAYAKRYRDKGVPPEEAAERAGTER
jgi:hypothetical protein